MGRPVAEDIYSCVVKVNVLCGLNKPVARLFDFALVEVKREIELPFYVSITNP